MTGLSLSKAQSIVDLTQKATERFGRKDIADQVTNTILDWYFSFGRVPSDQELDAALSGNLLYGGFQGEKFVGNPNYSPDINIGGFTKDPKYLKKVQDEYVQGEAFIKSLGYPTIFEDKLIAELRRTTQQKINEYNSSRG